MEFALPCFAKPPARNRRSEAAKNIGWLFCTGDLSQLACQLVVSRPFLLSRFTPIYSGVWIRARARRRGGDTSPALASALFFHPFFFTHVPVRTPQSASRPASGVWMSRPCQVSRSYRHPGWLRIPLCRVLRAVACPCHEVALLLSMPFVASFHESLALPSLSACLAFSTVLRTASRFCSCSLSSASAAFVSVSQNAEASRPPPRVLFTCLY